RRRQPVHGAGDGREHLLRVGVRGHVRDLQDRQRDPQHAGVARGRARGSRRAGVRRSRLSGRPVSDAPGSRDARALARVGGGWPGAGARGGGPEDEAMQKLETTFPTDYCNDVMRAVLRVRARCRMTATDVCFADSSTVHKVQYRGAIYELAWQLKTRLEILVADCDADAVRNALL